MELKNFIGGEFVDSASADRSPKSDASTGEEGVGRCALIGPSALWNAVRTDKNSTKNKGRCHEA